MAKKKVKTASELAKIERQAVEFTKANKLIKKGEKQLLSVEMAELFVKKGIAKKVEVNEEDYEKLIRFGKL